MGLTRDPDFPERPAALVAAFIAVADGYSCAEVCEAAFQLTLHTTVELALANNCSAGTVRNDARLIGARMTSAIIRNWESPPEPNGVPVPVTIGRT